MPDSSSQVDRADRLAVIGALGEPTRRAVYEHVARSATGSAATKRTIINDGPGGARRRTAHFRRRDRRAAQLPVQQLAQEHTELICGMNLCVMKAAVENVGETDLDARLEPEAGPCCVKLGLTR